VIRVERVAGGAKPAFDVGVRFLGLGAASETRAHA
jgi:hypothetical protein